MYTFTKYVLCLLSVGLLSRLALQSVGLFLRVKVADITGKTSNLRYEINTGHPDLADLATVAGAGGQTTIANVITRLNAVTTGAVVGYTVGESFAEDTTEFGVGDRRDKAVCSAAIDGVIGKRGTFRIPAPEDTVFINDGAEGEDAQTVDPADADLLAYAKMFQATSLTVTAQGALLISDGEQLKDDPVVKGRKI
jgi:hypothetical protein